MAATSERCAARVVARLATLLAALALAPAAPLAHPMPESRVWLDATPDGFTATLLLPLDRLEIAFGQPLAAEPRQVVAQQGEALARYLRAHVAVGGAGGDWSLAVGPMSVDDAPGHAELHATLALTAPAGADPRRATLRYDVIAHEIRTHRAVVQLRSDWAAGQADAPPLPLGEIRHETLSLPIDLPPARPGAALARLFGNGLRHIAEGTDHWLFVVLLALGAIGRADALRRLGGVVTAFALGHSLTLALGSTGLLVLPTRAVEVAVALTVAFTAGQLLRRGALAHAGGVAGAFGLVHGLAFSTGLSTAGLTAGRHAQALLAFNLGVETMQLLVLAATVPALRRAIGRWPALAGRVRIAVASMALAVSAVWVADRLGGLPPSWVETMDPLLQAGALAALVMLWLAAGAAWALSRARAARVPPAPGPRAPAPSARS